MLIQNQSSILPQILTFTVQCNEDLEFWGNNRPRSCLLARKVSGKEGKSTSQIETMQMWEGEIGEAERSVHTMYMAYTQSCAEHMTQRLRRTRHLEMGAGWDTEVRGEASTSTGDRGSTSFWKVGMGLGIWGRGGSDNMQEQIWSATTTEKKWEFLSLQTNKKK